MSSAGNNVYILPRRNLSSQTHRPQLAQQPVQPKFQQKQNQPQIVVVGGGVGGGGGRHLSALPAHKPGSRFVRANPVGLSNRGNKLLGQPHPSRMPLTVAGRRVYLAPSAVSQPQQSRQIVHQQQPMMNGGQSRRAHMLKKATTMPLVVEQSEEDEFDIDEVYQLLEESAGNRLLDEATIPRRRERLTNLTAEEKVNRRKQKNRVAAQAARDRKKESTKKLEETLKRALLEIGKLKSEVKSLRAANGKLANENQQTYQSTDNAEEFAYGTHQQIQQYHHAYAQPQQSQDHQQQNFVDMEEMKPAVAKYHQSQQMPTKPMRQPQQQQRVDSVGSAASFNGPQQRERETAQSQQQQPKQQNQQWPMAEQQAEMRQQQQIQICTAKMGNKERSLRKACFIKILMALSAVVSSNNNNKNAKDFPEEMTPVGKKKKKTSDCVKFSTNCLKNWTFPSMWTASAMKSLKRELLRKMFTMDRAKLLRLSKSPQRQLVAHLLVRRSKESANRKARGRHRSLTPMVDISNSMHSNSNTLVGTMMMMNSPLELKMTMSTTMSDQEEGEEDTAMAIVPQMLTTSPLPKH